MNLKIVGQRQVAISECELDSTAKISNTTISIIVHWDPGIGFSHKIGIFSCCWMNCTICFIQIAVIRIHILIVILLDCRLESSSSNYNIVFSVTINDRVTWSELVAIRIIAESIYWYTIPIIERNTMTDKGDKINWSLALTLHEIHPESPPQISVGEVT